MRQDVERHLAAWLRRPEISARTVLVTILGDVVRPVRRSLWLSQLGDLGDPFGFSTRLVRTSLSRLVSENWVESERIGRRSKYSLTTLALQESELADQRIYSPPRAAGDGRWSVVIIDPESIDEADWHAAVGELAWLGFTPVNDAVLVSPTVTAVRARQLFAERLPAASASIAEARFDDVGGLIAGADHTDPTGRSASGGAYAQLADTYKPFLRPGDGPLDGRDAYVLRVTLIHDLRRLVLRSAPTPRELLPDPWPGDQAFSVAAALYQRVCEDSAPWLALNLDTDYPKHFPDRFSALI